jgi:hypothetical protein
MLDLDHPQSAHVFAAARQEDLILDCCKVMTLSDANGRRRTLEIIRPAFAALRWLNRERFGNSEQIGAGIDQLEREAESLAALPVTGTRDRWTATFRQCPACGSEPNAPTQYDPRRYCSKCLDLVMAGLSRIRSLETGFGTDAI